MNPENPYSPIVDTDAGDYTLPSVASPRFTLFLVLHFVCIGLFTSIGLVDDESGDPSGLQIVLMLAMMATYVWALVLNMIFLHQMWAIIQDGHARTGAGQAVGFLFIPLFNIYWAVPAYHGLAQDYDAFVRRHGFVDAPRLPMSFFLIYAVCNSLGKVPCMGCISALPQAVLEPFKVYFICRALTYFAQQNASATDSAMDA